MSASASAPSAHAAARGWTVRPFMYDGSQYVWDCGEHQWRSTKLPDRCPECPYECPRCHNLQPGDDFRPSYKVCRGCRDRAAATRAKNAWATEARAAAKKSAKLALTTNQTTDFAEWLDDDLLVRMVETVPMSNERGRVAMWTKVRLASRRMCGAVDRHARGLVGRDCDRPTALWCLSRAGLVYTAGHMETRVMVPRSVLCCVSQLPQGNRQPIQWVVAVREAVRVHGSVEAAAHMRRYLTDIYMDLRPDSSTSIPDASKLTTVLAHRLLTGLFIEQMLDGAIAK
jgi:hypothetical protein